MDSVHFIRQLQSIFVDPAVEKDPQTKSILSRINADITKVCQPIEVFEFINQAEDPIEAGKKVLFLTQNRGRFLRRCPGTKHYECCRYMILHVGTYCPMDCAYCILQTFFHPPVLQYFVNHDVMDAELTHFFSTTSFRRIGTGEYTDSLIWSGWTPLVEKLVNRFGRQKRVALELKTKTNNVAELEHLDHNRKTIMAWSLNSETVIAANEIGTASLQTRLEAASRCQAWGYPLAFHFDPIIVQEDAEETYRAVVDRLFDCIDPENIAWISLGTFRCVPPLKSVIQRRFPESDFIYGEFVSGLDGKMRYFKPLRTNIYRSIIQAIRSRAPRVAVYFCMESRDVWERTLGFTAGADSALADRLDARAVKLCRLT
jgi:spore photoproduct lyase